LFFMFNKYKLGKSGGWITFLVIIIVALLLIVVWMLGKNYGGAAIEAPLDSDGDGLSDIEEAKLGTDPFNKNTDGDRYDDKEDSEPLKTNSACIDIKLIEKNWDWDIVNIGLLIVTLGGKGLLDTEMSMAEANTVVKVYNSGNDYSKYVNSSVSKLILVV